MSIPSAKPFTLITGASSGIGLATALALAKEGKNLILLARRQEKLTKIKNELESTHKITVLTHAVDVQDLAKVEEVFSNLQNLEIEALINNAGLAAGKETFENYDWADFEAMINTNIKGFLKVAQLTIPFLKKNQGHIVNISSVAGVEAYEGGSVYCATKAFVKTISKSLRIDLAGTGIRVTDIAPGNVETEFSNVRFKGNNTKADAVYQGFTPLTPDDIAECILFALSRPKSVNLEYMLVMPTAQASATRVYREE